MYFFSNVLAFLRFSTDFRVTAGAFSEAFSGGFVGPPGGIFSRASFVIPGFRPPSARYPNNATAAVVEPEVAAFVTALTRDIKSSKILSQLFDFRDTTGLEFAQFTYEFYLYWLRRWKTDDPEIAAEFASRPIAQNFPNLPLDPMIRTHGNVYGRFLYTEEILNQSNAQKLASILSKSLMESAKRNWNTRTDSKYLAIGLGCINFLSSAVRMTPAKGWKLAIIFGDSFLMEDILFGPGDFYIQLGI
ncbi:uncharacterized protein NPIL_511201 [Nephila pilipes]|uniref:Uncharacterized protein n=1 Tax=Nephila pilipes TaxID=299642 RepID=A0A8X6MNS4_NEPPI|nr:uncharacterized protein NPIL_511201 [Nephila pilipes]